MERIDHVNAVDEDTDNFQSTHGSVIQSRRINGGSGWLVNEGV